MLENEHLRCGMLVRVVSFFLKLFRYERIFFMCIISLSIVLSCHWCADLTVVVLVSLRLETNLCECYMIVQS